MSFEELFNQGAAHLREQKDLDKIRPATEVVGEAPARDEDDATSGLIIPAPDALPAFEPRRRRQV
ncbi:hypothetical protein [Demequina mangrovi]|uniref:Uncharacterized protein n=1 Tax=Demequina mangrovi TaxID=1043493 RepID=A0A1H6Y4L5_9MICO|nr:hypothetical protein [Demequina mangrovi]SEJ34824.1 hypothetical protein SAMN05421637_1507 [Demequina mangrovi]